MRVTDEMVERAAAVLDERIGWNDDPLRDATRAALEAALADVPDPYELTSDLVNADRRVEDLSMRLSLTREAWGMTSEAERELEAKLAEQEQRQLTMEAIAREQIDELDAKVQLTRARRTDLLALATEWLASGHGRRDALDGAQADVYFDCAEELRVLAERIPE